MLLNLKTIDFVPVVHAIVRTSNQKKDDSYTVEGAFSFPYVDLGAALQLSDQIPSQERDATLGYAMMFVRREQLSNLLSISTVCESFIERLRSIIFDGRDMSQFISCVALPDGQWLRVTKHNKGIFTEYVEYQLNELAALYHEIHTARFYGISSPFDVQLRRSLIEVAGKFVAHESYLAQLNKISAEFVDQAQSLRTHVQSYLKSIGLTLQQVAPFYAEGFHIHNLAKGRQEKVIANKSSPTKVRSELYASILAYESQYNIIMIDAFEVCRRLSTLLNNSQLVQSDFYTANIPLSRKLSAQSVRSFWHLRAEIYEAAKDGIFRAMNRYAPELGLAFSTLAVHWVKSTVDEIIFRQDVSLLSDHEHKKLRKIWNFKNQGIHDLEELSALADITPEKIQELLTRGQSVLSLDMPADNDEESGSLGDIISINDTAVEHFENDQVSRFLDGVLDNYLNKRESNIVKRRFGIGCDAETLIVIAEDFEVSPERIRQLTTQALLRLADSPISNELEDMLLDYA